MWMEDKTHVRPVIAGGPGKARDIIDIHIYVIFFNWMGKILKLNFVFDYYYFMDLKL